MTIEWVTEPKDVPRLQACLRACEGIPTGTLERLAANGATLLDFVEMVEHIHDRVEDYTCECPECNSMDKHLESCSLKRLAEIANAQ